MKTKKIEKQINKLIEEEHNVSDEVLNSALNAIDKKEIHSKHYILKRVLIPCTSLAVVLMIFVSTLLAISKGNNVSVGDTIPHIFFYYSDVNYNDIHSIEEYNKNNNTSYLYVNDMKTTSNSRRYNHKEDIILITEESKNDNFWIYEYILLDKNIYNFYEEITNKDNQFLQYQNIVVEYHIEGNLAYFKFSYLDYAYYFEMGNINKEKIRVEDVEFFIGKVLESQSERLTFLSIFLKK